MGVLYPINPKHYGYDGEEIKYENINEWSVGLSYGEAGVKHCFKNEIPVINSGYLLKFMDNYKLYLV
jgi:hypothetical protein